MFDEPFIHCSTAAAYSTAQHMGQVIQQGEVFFGFHAAAAGAYVRSIVDGHFAFADHFFSADAGYTVIHMVLQGVVDDFARTGSIRFHGLEGLGTDSTHLRTMFFAQDGSHDVTAGSRTGPFDQTVFFCIQDSAVCAQTGVHPGSDTGPQVTAVVGSADEYGRRLIFSDHFAESVGVFIRGIIFESRILADIDQIGAPSDQLGRNVFGIVGDQDSGQFLVAFVSQFPAFTQQFIYYMDRFAFVMFNIDP